MNPNDHKKKLAQHESSCPHGVRDGENCIECLEEFYLNGGFQFGEVRHQQFFEKLEMKEET